MVGYASTASSSEYQFVGHRALYSTILVVQESERVEEVRLWICVRLEEDIRYVVRRESFVNLLLRRKFPKFRPMLLENPQKCFQRHFLLNLKDFERRLRNLRRGRHPAHRRRTKTLRRKEPHIGVPLGFDLFVVWPPSILQEYELVGMFRIQVQRNVASRTSASDCSTEEYWLANQESVFPFCAVINQYFPCGEVAVDRVRQFWVISTPSVKHMLLLCLNCRNKLLMLKARCKFYGWVMSSLGWR